MQAPYGPYLISCVFYCPQYLANSGDTTNYLGAVEQLFQLRKNGQTYSRTCHVVSAIIESIIIIIIDHGRGHAHHKVGVVLNIVHLYTMQCHTQVEICTKRNKYDLHKVLVQKQTLDNEIAHKNFCLADYCALYKQEQTVCLFLTGL